MSEKSFTLLELHLDDSRIQIGPRTLSTGRSKARETEGDIDVVEGPSESADDSSGAGTVGSAAKAGLAVLVVVSLALAVWKLLGEGDLEAVTELDELAE